MNSQKTPVARAERVKGKVVEDNMREETEAMFFWSWSLVFALSEMGSAGNEVWHGVTYVS